MQNASQNQNAQSESEMCRGQGLKAPEVQGSREVQWSRPEAVRCVMWQGSIRGATPEARCKSCKGGGQKGRAQKAWEAQGSKARRPTICRKEAMRGASIKARRAARREARVRAKTGKGCKSQARSKGEVGACHKERVSISRRRVNHVERIALHEEEYNMSCRGKACYERGCGTKGN